MNIKQVRLMRSITQKQLADAIGVDHTVISKYEKGTVSPAPDKLKMIAEVLNVSIDDLLKDNHIQCEKKRVSAKASKKRLMAYADSFTRDRLIRQTKGHCELCGRLAPFEYNNKPYLELHYMKPIAEGGAPTINNMVVLCPNCHQRILKLQDPEDMKKLFEIAERHNAIEKSEHI